MLALTSCSTSTEEDLGTPTIETTTEPVTEASEASEVSEEPSSEVWVSAGSAQATYGDEVLDLSDGRVTCEVDNSTVAILVDVPDELNTSYWATL